MRSLVAFAVVMLAGCPHQGGNGGECQDDPDCGDDVCARDHTCRPAAGVREVKVTWTLRGMPAGPITCQGKEDLAISFRGGPGESLGFAPVPCFTGQFTIDKLPRSYDVVELGPEDSQFANETRIDANGMAAIDLRF